MVQNKTQELQKTIAVSTFFCDVMNKDPQLLIHLSELLNTQSQIDLIQYSEHYKAKLQQLLGNVADETQLMQQLRLFRRRESAIIAHIEINNLVTVAQSLHAISALAEAVIMQCYYWIYNHCCSQWGTPFAKIFSKSTRTETIEQQQMTIIAMGKLGGYELNFSSDIDLIFCYPEEGETENNIKLNATQNYANSSNKKAHKTLENSQFFTRLAQKTIKILSMHTADGFCYRVDMRLRPFGESGPLVISYGAMEDYYQNQGREWERYAMVKARVLGDDIQTQQTIRNLLRPFIYRRYIDFSAIESLREMKRMINSEVRRRHLTHNIKLGAGGIREIEFIAQIFQLIRGGGEPELRHRSLIKTLNQIEQLKLLDTSHVTHLKKSYFKLRRIENILQAMNEEQTQTLPVEPNQQQLLLLALNDLPASNTQWADWLTELQKNMRQTNQIFLELIGDPEPDQNNNDNPTLSLYDELWRCAEEFDQYPTHLSISDRPIEPLLLKQLSTLLNQVHNKQCTPETITNYAQELILLKEELNKRTIGHRGTQVLQQLMPKLLQKLLMHPHSLALLPRITALLKKIVTRTTYLELLLQYPKSIDQLLKLFAASPMIAEQLSRYPILLDALLTDSLYQPLNFSDYKQALTQHLARIPQQDMEAQMEALRHFKQLHFLKISAADIAGKMPLMKVSDHLTYLAEAIIDNVVNQAWGQLKEKFGTPCTLTDNQKGFIVLGYGKIGGWELGYRSDLDLVFLQNVPASVQTDGKRSIGSDSFYLKLAQRIIHLLTTITSSGILYEVDMRLRPSGNAGLLVSTLDHFLDYQQTQAWTWEKQALVRSRGICGDSELIEEFNKIRQQILTTSRDGTILKQEIIEMREKMRHHLDRSNETTFHLKQGRGGIVDIEFLAQYFVLNYSNQYPQLTKWQDNIRIFETMSELNLITIEQCQTLQDTYCYFRDETHRLNLNSKPGEVSFIAPYTTMSEQIYSLWQQWLLH